MARLEVFHVELVLVEVDGAAAVVEGEPERGLGAQAEDEEVAGAPGPEDGGDGPDVRVRHPVRRVREGRVVDQRIEHRQRQRPAGAGAGDGAGGGAVARDAGGGGTGGEVVGGVEEGEERGEGEAGGEDEEQHAPVARRRRRRLQLVSAAHGLHPRSGFLLPRRFVCARGWNRSARGGEGMETEEEEEEERKQGQLLLCGMVGSSQAQLGISFSLQVAAGSSGSEWRLLEPGGRVVTLSRRFQKSVATASRPVARCSCGPEW